MKKWQVCTCPSIDPNIFFWTSSFACKALNKCNLLLSPTHSMGKMIFLWLEESPPVPNNMLVYLEVVRLAGLLTAGKSALCSECCLTALLSRNGVTQLTVSGIQLKMSLWRPKANLHTNCYSKQVYTKTWQISEQLYQNTNTVLIHLHSTGPGLSAGLVLGEADACWLALTKLSWD